MSCYKRPRQYADAIIRAIVEPLVEASLVEAHGSSTARTHMLSAKAYNVAICEKDLLRLLDIPSFQHMSSTALSVISLRAKQDTLHFSVKNAYSNGFLDRDVSAVFFF